ncbi:phosphatase PAP2 family protein [Cryobacterium sp. PH31-L1]|uniref:phosphatase PAP2 family protein n=1 Tax=Cryobacterium sp. PH31-L1 TaxID=3046199 RepID=UPI0024BA2C9E|nr:phosphatase PAP2 family protein [Cryobacterium sp. PH31-L1]MDJ0379021.1 phosphatase PAP2 family protein [Cryobacterium sp. PH31-L1]
MSTSITPPDARARLTHLPQLRRWITVPLLLVLVTLILGFGVKLFPRLSGAEFRIDQLLSRDHIAVGNAIALTINTVLSPPAIILILLLLFAFLLFVRRSPVNSFAVTSVAAVGWLSSEVFKLLVAQPRPDLHLLQNPLVPSDGSGSFPSGHTTFAVAFAIAIYFLARGTRWAVSAAIVGLGFALVVAASRLYLGVHYASEVLGSFLVATAVIAFYTGLWNRYGMRVLNRIPFLDRIGPIPSTDHQPHDRRSTGRPVPDAR